MPVIKMDYVSLYNLETYLFDTVRPRFIENGYLSAFDFFCIMIWKANRAKSYAAKKLLSKGFDNLDEAVYKLTTGLAALSRPKERLQYLWDWGNWEFRLPTATAILTVLYPEDFTIYDVRVCDMLGSFHNLGDTSKFETLWRRYEEFKVKVENLAPIELSLRDKDRYLWGKSFHDQLLFDIKQGFKSSE